MEKLLALKAKLTSGEITQDVFSTELATLLASGEITQEQHDEAIKGDEDKPLTRKEIEDIIALEKQRAADKVRTEYAKKLADEKAAREKLELEKMTEQQQADYKRKQLEEDLLKREAELNKREVELHVVDQLTAHTMPLDFKPFFVNAASKDEAEAHIKTLANVWQTALKQAVEERFKEVGDKRGGGGGGNGAAKKWSDMSLTEQSELFSTDPKKAISLAKESGVTLSEY